MDVYYTASSPGDRINLANSGSKKRMFLMSFGATTDFAGATVDSAKLHIYSSAGTGADSVFVWSCTNSDLQGWDDDYDDISWKESDASASTAWGGLLNLAEINETNAGEYIGISGPTNSGWASEIDVTTLIQDQIDNSMNINFLFSPWENVQSAVLWGVHNGEDADANKRPYLEVWVSE